MRSTEKMKRVTVLAKHAHHEHHGDPYAQMLEALAKDGATNVAVFRAVAAIDEKGHTQTMRLAEITPVLPTMLVWFDTAERVEEMLPRLSELLPDGLITVDDVTAVR